MYCCLVEEVCLVKAGIIKLYDGDETLRVVLWVFGETFDQVFDS